MVQIRIIALIIVQYNVTPLHVTKKVTHNVFFFYMFYSNVKKERMFWRISIIKSKRNYIAIIP